MIVSFSRLINYITNVVIALALVYPIVAIQYGIIVTQPLALKSFVLPTIIATTLAVLITRILELNKQYLSEKELTKLASRENELLLREVHHRVKNNLQIVSSLLNLQSSTAQNPQAQALLLESQNKIASMALLHEMLYQEDRVSEINYTDYLSRLVPNLIQSARRIKHHIDYNIDVPGVYFNMDTSIPLSLIINEIITNSLKHGFGPNDKGLINITIRKLESPQFFLEIGDDGLGSHENMQANRSDSLGLELVRGLILQLNGEFEKDNTKKGTHYIFHLQEIGRVN